MHVCLYGLLCIVNVVSYTYVYFCIVISLVAKYVDKFMHFVYIRVCIFTRPGKNNSPTGLNINYKSINQSINHRSAVA